MSIIQNFLSFLYDYRPVEVDNAKLSNRRLKVILFKLIKFQKKYQFELVFLKKTH